MSKDDARMWLQILLPLAAGLVGVGLGGAISIFTVERQIQVGQDTEERATRAEAYLAVVDAADDYANRTQDVLDALPIRGGIDPADMETYRAEPNVSRWLDARNVFQDTLNRAYIYGSSDGWAAVQDLAGDLPYARGEEYEWVPVAPTMGDSYRELLRVVCEESTVTPRRDCEDNTPGG